MAKIENIFVHCSDSEWGCSTVINEWHKQRGWNKIGYHFIILNGFIKSGQTDRWNILNGSIEVGRPIDTDDSIESDEIGAHVYGWNGNSIGICLIGVNSFTSEQLLKVRQLIIDLCKEWKLSYSSVKGHYETDSNKTCPNIDMNIFREFLNDTSFLVELIK